MDDASRPLEQEDEVWDDDFAGDVGMDGPPSKQRGLAQAISLESRHSIEEWADNDDDEDNWKDALQARVDQLELVVDRKADALQQKTRPAAAAKGFAVPYDQRATLTLLPKTNLTRSISAPAAAEEHKPASKLKAPSVVRSTTTTLGSKPKPGGSDTNAALPGDGNSDQAQARKRSNSRDFLAHHTLATEHNRLAKPSTPPSASNSVFVRAVVARGNSASRNLDGRIGDVGHVDKRAKADDDGSTVPISEAEAVRRHILNDIKKISVERIIADARRLHYLEDFYRRHPETAELKRSISTSAMGDGARQSLSRNNNAV